MTDSIEWAVGIFEGEGSIDTKVERRPNDRIYRYPRLQLSMTDEDTVRRFVDVVGGTVRGPYPNGEGHKQVWRWVVSHRSAEAVMQRFLPLLGERRTAKWAEVMGIRGRVAA